MTFRLPGLIDCHVHFREPGYEHKADMESESLAAYEGGVRTVCEMPNTNPPTTSVEAFRDKVRRASRIENVDIRFFFGITEISHLEGLRTVWDDVVLRSKCSGVKLYFDHSTGNQGANADVIEEAFKVCAELDVPVVAHCEDAGMNAEAKRIVNEDIGGSSVALHSLHRPPESEALAIEHAIKLARQFGTQLHVAHLSTLQGIDLVKGAKTEKLKVTCEVAPHHLFLSTEDYATLGALGKMNPPLREEAHCKALWQGITDKTVDCISTDHAPHTLEEKQNPDPLAAPSGVPGTETMLPLLLTVALGGWPHPHQKRLIENFTIEDIIRLCFTNPNRIFRLGADKSPRLEIDPEAKRTIHAAELHSKCGWTPYEGWQVLGKVIPV
jgi:dihydroorotase